MKKIKQPQILDGEESLSAALTLLMNEGTAVFITKNGKYAGLIDDRNMSLNLSDYSKAKCINFVESSPVLNLNSSVEEEIDAFLSGKHKALPVVDPKTEKIIGAVTRLEILDEILDNHSFQSESVWDFANKPVYSIDISSNMGAAKKTLKEKKVHKLLVTDKGKARGIISTYDLSALIRAPKKRDRSPMITEIKRLDDTPISEFIREKIISVDKSFLVLDAMKKMIQNEVSNLLITQDSNPAGMLSATDIFKNLKAVSKKGFGIQVSGLDSEQDRQQYPDIMKKFNLIFEKYSKNFSFENISIHIKKGRSVYEGKLRATINGKTSSFSDSEHKIPYLADKLANELKRVLSKSQNKKSTLKKSGR